MPNPQAGMHGSTPANAESYNFLDSIYGSSIFLEITGFGLDTELMYSMSSLLNNYATGMLL